MDNFPNEGGISRRLFLQISGAGVVTATALGCGLLSARAKRYEGRFTWNSPPGTSEVSDD